MSKYINNNNSSTDTGRADPLLPKEPTHPKLRIGRVTEEDLPNMSKHELLNFRLHVEDNIRSIKDQLELYAGGDEDWYRRTKFALKCNRQMIGKVYLQQSKHKDTSARLFVAVAMEKLSDKALNAIWKEVRLRDSEAQGSRADADEKPAQPQRLETVADREGD